MDAENTVEFELNGQPVMAHAATNQMLSDVLREEFGLSGTKIACDQVVCGACTVLVDGLPYTSCHTFIFEVAGRLVTTIEGLQQASGELHVVQQAFAETEAFQCGFCTPGMIMAVTALLDRNPEPSRHEIAEWLEGNICRCTGYQMIFDAVELAASRIASPEGVR